MKTGLLLNVGFNIWKPTSVMAAGLQEWIRKCSAFLEEAVESNSIRCDYVDLCESDFSALW
jgi:hypothetical protein